MVGTLLSKMSFSHLVCYTFPGIFTALSILITIFYLFNDSLNLIDFLKDPMIFIGILTLIIFLGTVIGIILDTIHHIIEYILLFILPAGIKIRKKEKEIFKDLEGNSVHFYYYIGFLPLERVQFLYENFYYYVESLFNLSLSFFFSAIILRLFIFTNEFIIIFYLLIILSFFCLVSGIMGFIVYRKRRIELIKGALDHYKKENILSYYD